MRDGEFLPYGRQCIEADDIAAVVEVLRSDYLTTGPAVSGFESALADAVGADFAVAVSSGTAALHAAYFAAGVREGDEVIVPATTFVATANAARFLGAEPVFADVDPDTGLIRADEVERLLNEKTRAIAPVHMTGATAPMAAIATLAERVGATVVEDACHALGATIETERVGACRRFSALAAFSFHPVKHVAMGEGGAITGNDPALERRLRQFRNHGITRDPAEFQQPSPGPWYYEQHALGHNLRLTDIQAALGTSQLAKLDRFVAKRRALAQAYDARLAELPHIAPVTTTALAAGSAYHLYAVLLDFEQLGRTRTEVMNGLRARGIGTQVHYIPVTDQPYYTARGVRGEDFPGARRYHARTLSLPLFPGMEVDDVDRVVEALQAVLADAPTP